jgi:hypothetical protein
MDLYFYVIIKEIHLGGALLNTKKKAMLKSKLLVYKVCYQQAEKQKDHTRMDKIEVFIDELQEEIDSMD